MATRRGYGPQPALLIVDQGHREFPWRRDTRAMGYVDPPAAGGRRLEELGPGFSCVIVPAGLSGRFDVTGGGVSGWSRG